MTARTADRVRSPSARQTQAGTAVRAGAVAVVSDILDAADLKMDAGLDGLDFGEEFFILLLTLPCVAGHHAQKQAAEQQHRNPIDHTPPDHPIEQQQNHMLLLPLMLKMKLMLVHELKQLKMLMHP